MIIFAPSVWCVRGGGGEEGGEWRGKGGGWSGGGEEGGEWRGKGGEEGEVRVEEEKEGRRGDVVIRVPCLST